MSRLYVLTTFLTILTVTLCFRNPLTIAFTVVLLHFIFQLVLNARKVMYKGNLHLFMNDKSREFQRILHAVCK